MLNRTESSIRDAMLRLKNEQTKEIMFFNKGSVLIDRDFYEQAWSSEISAKARSMLFHTILRCYTHRDGIIPLEALRDKNFSSRSTILKYAKELEGLGLSLIKNVNRRTVISLEALEFVKFEDSCE